MATRIAVSARANASGGATKRRSRRQQRRKGEKMSTQALVVPSQHRAITEVSSPESSHPLPLMKLNEIEGLARILSRSGYFTDAKSEAQAAVKIMAGQELGIPPIAAMMGINIVKGKVELGGTLIASRIIANGYRVVHVRLDNTGCLLR